MKGVTHVQNANAVLRLNAEDNVSKIDVIYITDSTIPEELDGESGFHIYHVRMLTELILRQLSETEGYALSDDEIDAIAGASSLHDIGKSRIPRSISTIPSSCRRSNTIS